MGPRKEDARWSTKAAVELDVRRAAPIMGQALVAVGVLPERSGRPALPRWTVKRSVTIEPCRARTYA